MKKLMILVSAVALSGTMFAQKGTTDNPYTLEGSINYTTADGMDWQAPNVRLRYFIKDNMAGRMTLGYAKATENDSNSVSGSSIGLGFEQHLAGNDQMSPYFTAGLTLGSGNTQINGVDASSSSLGFGLGAGLDYYIRENIYLGLEIGLVNYSSDTSGEGDTKNTTSGLQLGGNSAIRLGWRF